MRKIFNFGLMAVLVCGIGMFVSSCDDDKDGGKTEEQKQQEVAAQASKAFKFYDVVSQLADLSDMDDATYETQTFEPIIGEVSENDPLTRIVATNDLETAAARFADIIGLSVGSGFSASTSSYTYNDPDVGTMKWTKSTDGTSWATVEVKIKQVPHLERIVYCTLEQMGENASKNWTAYYRFGDVISREYTSKNGNKCTEYWICVRPAFSIEGKGDNHWISVGQLPEDYMQRYPTTEGEMWDGNKVWYVPTKVCTDTENMQNFAEMLYAIFNPKDWESNLKRYAKDGLKMFWEFDVDSIKYHNQYFWQNVYKGWEEAGIARKAFNMNSMAELDEALHSDGLNLLYKGYSWYYNLPEWMGGWNCELYTACFSTGTENAEQNFHHVDYEKVTKSMKDLQFDCRNMGRDVNQYREFFGQNDLTHRWVVRYAKGKQLMAHGTFNKFEGIVGCNDVWNYNKKYGPTSNLSNTRPQETPEPPKVLDTPVVGCIIADDGKFYNKAEDGVKAVAKVVYVGAPGSVESGTNYRGLAIATSFDESYGLWEQSNSTNCQTTKTRQRSDFANILDGISVTSILADGCGSLEHEHRLANFCRNLRLISAQKRKEAHLSEWFIPSVGQWILTLKGLGMIYDASTGSFSGLTFTQLNEKLNTDGYYFGFDDGYYYYTSTQFGNVGNATDMYSVFMADGVPTFFNIQKNNDGYERRVRPFIAF